MSENDNASAAPMSETDEPSATGADAGTTDATTAADASGASAQTAQGEGEGAAATPAAPPEDITYHAVEKDGHVTAIWEMQGRKHLRTIDPRSRQGQEILRLYTAEHTEEQSA